MSILQEMPISKPYSAEEIDHLVNLATTTSLAPYYVDVGPCSTTLLAMIDRMKSVSGTLMMATCKVRGSKQKQLVPELLTKSCKDCKMLYSLTEVRKVSR
jgi:hypothetical protein